MRSLYHYRPLEHTNSFRLLTLHSASEPSDPIRCSLQHALLSEPLDYEAVSYTWGEVTTLYPILVEHDWSELFVRINCYNMLHHLRHADHDRLLWIDAICINQTDLDERGHQVKSMDKIYKHASRVVVHLGEETPGSRILFEELAEADMELSETGQCIQRDPRQSSKEELEKLLQRPWFYRVWVLQEVKNNPCILYMCGSAQTSAKILNLWLEQCRVRVLESVEDDWPLGVALGRVPQDKTYCNAQFGLWSWLLRSRSCLASDPRDKIFALKSLISEEHVRKAMDILIDYTKTTEETFIATALFLISVIGLRIFGATRRPHDLAMPSWIPDFSQTLPIGWSFYPHKLGSDNPETDFLVETRSRNAGFFKADFNAQKHGEPPKIHVVALPYATICHSSDTFSFQTLEDAHDQLIMLYHLPSRPGALTNADTSARKTSIAGNLCPQILDGELSVFTIPKFTHPYSSDQTSPPR
jgi:hypothetical protein